MKMRREWAIPNKNTFRCPPIGAFANYYLQNSHVSIDPFARNFTGCTYTNDLNHDTEAQYHMDALDFLMMIRDKNIRPDLVVFDPPYSPRQIKECYNGIGMPMQKEDAQRSCDWTAEKDIIAELLDPDRIFLHFGWNSQGMGMKRNFIIEEILLVCHGPGANDTICIAERKVSEQLRLF